MKNLVLLDLCCSICCGCCLVWLWLIIYCNVKIIIYWLIFLFLHLQKIDEKAINDVFLKVLGNYIKWCKYLRIRVAWNRSVVNMLLFWNSWFLCSLLIRVLIVHSIEAINRDRKLFLVSLYFLIWGEAANVRFLPECICYIFHHVSLYQWSYNLLTFCSAIIFCSILI